MTTSFQIKDRVFCRDSEGKKWLEGVVTSVSPLEVLVDNWPVSMQFALVRPFEKKQTMLVKIEKFKLKLVVGKRGNGLKKIHQDFQTKATQVESGIELFGYLSSIQAAKKRIEHILSQVYWEHERAMKNFKALQAIPDDLNRSLGRWSPKKANLYEGIEDIYVENEEIIEESGYYYIIVSIVSINPRLSHRVFKEATAKLQRRKMKNPGNALDYAFGKRYKRLHRKVVPMVKKSKWKSWNKRTQKIKQRAWTKKRKTQRAFKVLQNKPF